MKRFLIGLVAIAAVLVNPAAFAQVKISELPNATTLTGAEEFAGVQSGVTSGVLASQIQAYIFTQLSSTGLFSVSGQWQFTGGSTGLVPSVQLMGGNPQFELRNSVATANSQRWNETVSAAGLYEFRALTDGGAASNAYTIARSAGTAGTFTHLTPTLITAPLSGTTSSLTLSSGTPQLELSNTSAPVNNRRATQYIDNAGTHRWGVCQDNTTCNDYLQITRTGSSINGFKVLTNNSNERLHIDQNGAWIMGGTSAGTTGQVLTSTGATTPPVWQDAGAGVTLANGTWTPVCTTGGAPLVCTGTIGNYLRVGNQVSVTFAFNANTTNATGSASFSIPVPSLMTGNIAVGNCTSTGSSGSVGRVTSGGAQALSVTLNFTQTVSVPWSCTAMYTVN